MKKTLLAIIVVCLLSGSVSSLFAVPISDPNCGRSYLMGWADLSKWTLGVYNDGWNRDVRFFLLDTSMQSQKVMGFLSYDLVRWMSIYGTGGSSKMKAFGGSETAGEIGGGLLFNIIDHEIADPTFIEDRLRLNMGVQYTMGTMTWSGRSVHWVEQSASLTLAFVNDLEGDRRFIPNGMSFFAGPVYSDLQSSVLGERGKWGYTAGAELFYSENVSFYIRTLDIDKGVFMGGVNIRL